jgi:hypothetical protein
VIGRFISTDPKQFDEENPHLFNRYAYANNNPYKYHDPDGQMSVLLYGAAGLGLGLAMLPEDKRKEMTLSLVNGVRHLYNIYSENKGEQSQAEGGEKSPPVPDAKPGRETKGRTTQWEKPGSMADADRDFDKLNPSGVRELPNGGRSGTLSDGRTVVVRPESTDGRPTLEIQDGKNRDKVRYGE